MVEVNRGRLRQLLAERNRSARNVSLCAGLGETAVKDILSGKSRDPGAGTLSAIATELAVPVQELIIEDGPDSTAERYIVPRYLPVRYKVQAGLWFETDADEPPVQVSHPVIPDPRYAAWPQWLELVQGDSVNQKIPPGHYAHVVDAIEMGYAPRDGDWVVVERRRGAARERTIKQIAIGSTGVELWPRSTNPRWTEAVKLTAGVHDNEEIEVEIVGLVIGAYNPDFGR